MCLIFCGLAQEKGDPVHKGSGGHKTEERLDVC